MNIISILVVLASNALAGGDYRTGKVTAFSGQNGQYSMHFIQTSTHTLLVPKCSAIDVKITFKRVPWFSWLPFYEGGNPGKGETLKAAELLRAAHQNGREIKFGYMGHGLVGTDKDNPCAFSSWQLGILKDEKDGTDIIMAFHDLI